ncbi:MAG TPA: AMP-binding protein, partial [Chloroflexota bacterium]|nr:AMP-binding protein [Chloroflexota bacterium]
ENDRWLACLPLFHVGGMSILVRAVVYGIGVVIHESFDPIAVNQAIDEQHVTIVSVVSVMLERMLATRGSRSYPPSLRCVLLGGGPASAQLLFDCAAGNLPVVQTYGLTEAASQVATLAPEDALRKLGSAGKPLFPSELRIERDGIAAGSGEVGEIVVAGPTISPGYLNQPDETATAFQDGWLHTGDLGYLDGEGFLYVVDRRDDLVISGGENVYPAEVERVLREHPSVDEAVVVGLPDPRWGQGVAAAIQIKVEASLTAAEIIDFCRARLAGYKVPTTVRFVDDLPRNAAGKILRRELRDTWPVDSAAQ